MNNEWNVNFLWNTFHWSKHVWNYPFNIADDVANVQEYGLELSEFKLQSR